MSSQAVFIAIKQLLEIGKVPSVATIKAQAGGGIPLPDIIKSLKAWQQNPNIIDSLTSTTSGSTSKDSENPPLLSAEQRLIRIEAELKEIKQLLLKLTDVRKS